jgi:superfamily II DNA/RNA helicase
VGGQNRLSRNFAVYAIHGELEPDKRKKKIKKGKVREGFNLPMLKAPSRG